MRSCSFVNVTSWCCTFWNISGGSDNVSSTLRLRIIQHENQPLQLDYSFANPTASYQLATLQKDDSFRQEISIHDGSREDDRNIWHASRPCSFNQTGEITGRWEPEMKHDKHGVNVEKCCSALCILQMTIWNFALSSGYGQPISTNPRWKLCLGRKDG